MNPRLLLLFGAVIGTPLFTLSAELQNENATQADQLVYSNTLGSSAMSFGAATMIADDIAITRADGCQLARFEFDIDGNTDGKGIGPFAVDFQLYTACPGSGGLPIAGTQGHVIMPNEGKYTIAFNIPGNAQVTIPRSVWLAVTFDRDHAGWVGGAPALVGSSDDWFYYSLFGCEFSFGGYPTAVHSSMNARLYVRDACPEVHAGYHAKTPRRGPFNPGEGLRMADDLHLDGECQMVAYEVTVRGTALYDMDFRGNGAGGLPGQIISGTPRSIQHFSSLTRTIRQDFDPPIVLPQTVWFTILADSSFGRTMVAGLPAKVGTSDSGYAVLNGPVWQLRKFSDSLSNGALEVTILCAGSAAMGACCDMQYLDANGQAVCREGTRANCPYPAPGSSLLPAWREGDSCASDPFNPPCGTAACCRADGSCMNYTENFCEPRGTSWTRGSYCGSPEISCEPTTCTILSDEPCTIAHTTRGCIDPFCCASVCSSPGQGFCCNVAWDANCASHAAVTCGLTPLNDECFGTGSAEGARLITTSLPGDGDTVNATESEGDPEFCCHSSAPGTRGLGTTWFRFVATTTTARLRTCTSSAPASDSLIQIFESADSSTPEKACATLRSIGCSDDVAGCSTGGLNSQLCVRNLTVGRTYYVLLAAKNDEARGLYRLTLSTSCNDPVPAKCDCPGGIVKWLDPPTNAVDARRPHSRADSAALEGLTTFLVQAPQGSDKKECWTLCETAQAGAVNEVLAASYAGLGRYILTLKRPLTPGAVTTLSLNGDPLTRGVFYSHPANISADSTSAPTDLLDLIDALNGVRFLPWGMLSGDIDHSGVLGPTDILEMIDLLNGADAFAIWNGVSRPDPAPCLTSP